jgi:hypothetical protein
MISRQEEREMETNKKADAVVQVAHAVLCAINEGDTGFGVPGGTIWAAMMTFGLPYNSFEQLMSLLERGGMVERRGDHTYKITEKGKQVVPPGGARMKVSRKESSKQLTEVIAAIEAAQQRLSQLIDDGDFTGYHKAVLTHIHDVLGDKIGRIEELQWDMEWAENESVYTCPHGRIMHNCPSCARPHRFSNRKEVREEILKGEG